MAVFTGSLNTNKMFAGLFNMIISQQVFGTGISDLSGIYGSRKVDGTLYGDTKLFYSTDALKSYDWETVNYNILTKHKPPMPEVDAIEIGVYRQIPVTVDDYLTKQAWSDEGSFSQFNGVILEWMSRTKMVYEHTKYTTDIIITAADEATTYGNINLAAPSGVAGYDLLVWRAQELFRNIEDAMTELNEPSRKYNDLGFLRNYKMEDFDIVVPLGILSSVRKHDVPFLYNADEKPLLKEIHWKYFGTKITTTGTTGANNTTVRSFVERDYGDVHVFPGDLLPNSTAYLANEVYTAKYTARPSINAAFDVLFIHKDDFPIMSAFSTQTNFFDPVKLDSTYYLTFGHNVVEDAHLREHALLKMSVSV